MAGAAHTLPVVIQYVLYNSGEQQALSRCRKQRHPDPVIHSRLLTHDRSPCLRPFLHRTLNHTPQAASTHATDTGFQLWGQNSSQPELVVKPGSQPVRRNQFVRLPGVQLCRESCSCSGYGAACAASRPARLLFTHRNYAKCKKSASRGGVLEKRSVLWFSHRHWTCWALCICYSLYTSLCACVTCGVWAHSNIVMM